MAERRGVYQVDSSTGEILEGATLVVCYPKRKNGFGIGGWLAMAQDPMEQLAKANIGGEAMRVLFIVLGRLDFENWIHISQAEIADFLSMKRPHVTRAITKLVAEGVLERGPKVGRNATYRLNPTYGWKGSAKGHHEALAERMRARGISVIEGGGAAQSGDEPIDTRTLDLFAERPAT